MIGSRLSDPRKCSGGSALSKLQDKISATMTRMFRKPVNGGNPFLFALTAPKPHELAVKLGSQNIDTAATDGRRFYWNPDFLGQLDHDQTTLVMEHEGYHVAFFHTKRGRGKEPQVWNWAVDYVVNACIYDDYAKTDRRTASGKSGPPFGGVLGEPLLLKDLLEWIDGGGKKISEDDKVCFADASLFGRSPESIYDEIIDHWNKSPRKCPKCGALSLDPKTGQPQKGKGQKDEQGDDGDGDGDGQGQDAQGAGAGGSDGQGGGDGTQPGCGCGDGDEDGQSCGAGQQPGSQPGQGGQGGGGQPTQGCGKCPTCGSNMNPLGGMDSHIECEMTEQEVQADLMRAVDQASQMRGSVPAGIAGVLGELRKPTLKFTDIVRSALLRKILDTGKNNDWKRMRRRYLATNPRQFLPRRHMHAPKWVAAIDTSGSMSDDMLVYAVSQLQVLGNNTEGLVVPWDSQVYWDQATRVEKADDLKVTKIVGRGGTTASEFLRDFPKKIGMDFDVVIIMTDGYIESVDPKLRPPCDVVWVLTAPNEGFKPPFGRVCPLKHETA